MRPSGPQPDDIEWVSPWSDATDAALAARGLRRRRLLHQMRRPLPVDVGTRGGAPPLPVRPFRPGPDDDDWLQVNNAAFAWHPDQGGWDAALLVERLAEDWVDLDGFLVHDSSDGTIDGFCWTRVHPPAGADPAMGEIFVVAARPDTHGTGLGRALTLAGLDHLAGQGLGVAMLYVEADNAPAVRLYGRLGFTVHHSDAAYSPSSP